jgi:sugar lactone lactonase YvrE
LVLVLLLLSGTVPAQAADGLTREAFFVMLAETVLYHSGAPLTLGAEYDTAVFADLAEVRTQNRPYIMFLYGQGIVNGEITDDGTRYIRPHAPLTRQDAVVGLGRWLGLTQGGGVVQRDTLFADDEAIAGYARGFVYRLADMGIVTEYPGGYFKPLDPISYAETSAFIINIIGASLLRTHFGSGLETLFANPYGLTFDNNGNLIVFDTYNAGVKRLDSHSAQTLLGFDTVPDGFGFAAPGYLDGPQATARFARPTGGVYAPNGDLFIVDRDNHAIRLLRDGRVYTFAARFNYPAAIAISKNGDLYVADTMNHTIRRITPDGVVTTIAGKGGTPGYADGRGDAARFCEPSGIAVCDNGIIYVADTGNHLIRRIENGNVTTVAGVVTPIPDGEDYRTGGFADGAGRFARFNFPRGLFWADGVLFIADTGNHAVRALTPSGNVITLAGNGEPGDFDGLPKGATLNKPTAAVYGNGTLYIADMLNNKIKALPIDLKGGDLR